MSYIFTPSQMKTLDENTINCFGLPARILMENAGKGCADYLLQNCSEHLNNVIIILHGTGNNSGDGFVLARWLTIYGRRVLLCKVQDGTMTEECRLNYELCQSLNIPMIGLDNISDTLEILDNSSYIGMIVDAVFGTGYKGKLPTSLKKIFQSANNSPAFKVAIDIPSGLNGATGEGEDAFEADLTLCLHSPKIGSLLHTGKLKSGDLVTIPIGIPDSYNDAFFSPALHIDAETFQVPKRYLLANKSDYGRVFIIGGSMGLLGSVAMSAKAALRAGAGLVYLVSREEYAYFYNTNPSEVLFVGIPSKPESLLPDLSEFSSLIKKADSIVIGPGLGTDEYGYIMLEFILRTSTVPTVVDADALRLIAKEPSLQQYIKKPNILLTPHFGEFCDLAKIEMSALYKDTISELTKYVKNTEAKVLLKSDTTIFYDGKRMLINTTGNDGLASGGSGDVLTGIIGSFCGQDMELGEAAINASFFMGFTTEYLATKRYPCSILPTDIIDNLFVRLVQEGSNE